MINISKSSATTRQGDIFLMEEFFISTTLTPDLIKRYIDSIWKIVSKKFRRIKSYRYFLDSFGPYSFGIWFLRVYKISLHFKIYRHCNN